MGIIKTKEKVRDGFLGDLPQDLQTKVMNIHKLIKTTVKDLLDNDNYSDLKESRWAMTCIDDFCVMPKDKSDIGSVRVFKNGKTNRCMIQATGHFRNHQYGWIEELLHDFICNVYSTIRPKIRRHYDMTITNEGRSGNSYEGFDIYPNAKIAKEIWDKFEDKKTKAITEDGIEIDLTDGSFMFERRHQITISDDLKNYYENYSNISFDQYMYEKSYNLLKDIHDKEEKGFVHKRSENYMIEKSEIPTQEYNVEMSEAQAKKTLRTLSQTIMNDCENKKEYKISQYTANIYANIITKNLLPIWAKGYRKFSITLDSYQSFHTFEFKVPTMTQDFVARFINGRESINGFLHRTPEIKIKMSPRIFHTMKNPDDAYNFFKAAIKYYDSSLEKTCSKLMIETMKLNHEIKHLISTTKMSGIVIYPLSLLFKFEDVQISNKDTFKISQDDINTVNRFVKSIYTKYAAPEKEKKQIVDDIKEVVKALREYSSDDENIKQLIYLPEAVEKYLFEGYTKEINQSNELWIKESIDTEWLLNQKDPKISYLQEKFGVKKLKKIPTDLVAYIQIETESIKDANDKMMISSYCLGKIEIVEWYIELLEVGSKKYIVPHTKPYLENVRIQLLACFKKIMDTPIPKKDRPIIGIQYPKGYEG